MIPVVISAGFVQNLGQVRDFWGFPVKEVILYTFHQNVGIFITKGGMSFVFYKPSGSPPYFHRVDYEIVNGEIKRENIVYELPQEYINFYIGGKHYLLRSYERVIIKNVLEGVDWVLKFENGDFHHEFLIHPGVEPSKIKIRVKNAGILPVDNGKGILLKTPLGILNDGGLVAYTGHRPIPAEFKIENGFITFNIGGYTREDTITIDPYILVWSTYYGGQFEDMGNDLCIDVYGNIIITGSTFSPTFPTTPKDTSRYSQVEKAGFYDAFIVKFDRFGRRVWATYYGGSGSDYGTSIKTDAYGNIYLVGYTYSDDLPVLNPGGGAYFQGARAGRGDMFIAKFSENGALQWATYYGGSRDECLEGYCNVELDNFGNVWVVGSTSSLDIYVHNPGSGYFQDTLAGRTDAFILKFSPSGQMLWATYYGGSDYDYAYGIKSDLWGNVFITGKTYSNNLPVYDPGGGAYFQLCGTDGNCNGGFYDIFIVKFSNSGVILWATYYGGRYGDAGYSAYTDGFGNVYITGQTLSPDLPVLNSGGYFQDGYMGGGDAFILKFSNAGVRLWATYYGGSAYDIGFSIITDFMGNTFLIGRTNSTDLPTMEVPGGYFQETLNGLNDAFISQFSFDNRLIWATYYGGSNRDCHPSRCVVRFDTYGYIYIFGSTDSPDFPINNTSPYPGIYFDGGCGDDRLCDYSFDNFYYPDAFISRFYNYTLNVEEWVRGLYGKRVYVKVYSSNGRLVKEGFVNGEGIQRIVGDVGKGVYLVKVYYRGRFLKTLKFINR
ncbi:MAG: SBBP repeat-containing protein [candidate division WOR-3 bacterium]